MTATVILLGVLTVTSYRPIRAQTDDSPTWTSIGDRTTKFGIAVSQDLLRSGEVKYGDILCVSGYPCRIVNDAMGPKARRAVDMLVFTKQEERAIGVKHLKVYRVGVNL